MLDPQATSSSSAAITLTTALGPAFAAGFAIQQLLEILDPVFSAIWPATDAATGSAQKKKVALGMLSLALGISIAYCCGLHVLQALLPALANGKPPEPVTGDTFLTGLIISAGTEGLNTIVKFVGYAKDAKKGEAADQLGKASPTGLRAINR